MRIGFITGEYPPMQGGVGAFTRELAKAMAAEGHELFVLTDERAREGSEPGIHVSGLIRNWTWGSLVQVRRWARAHQIDIVNIQYQAAAFQMAPFVHLIPSRLSGYPVVTTFHDLLVPYLFPKAGPLRYQAVLTLARSSDGVIVTNREDERRLAGERGVARLRAIPIGSNIPLRPPPGYDRAALRASLGVPPDAFLAGYFGFMNASKGIEAMLDAVDMAIKGGLNLHLVMIGGRVGDSDPSNVKYAEAIDALIGGLALGPRLHWTGFVNEADVSAHLLACDFLILPYNDGVSFRRGSFMAGLAHGCAIITTTPTFELPELRDGVNVRLTPPGSPLALRQAIESLCDNEPLRRTLQENARALSEQFSWERIARQTLDYFEEVRAHAGAAEPGRTPIAESDIDG